MFFQRGGEPICLIVCTFWNMKGVGLFLPGCSDRIGNVLAHADWKCTPTPRSTSSRAIIYTHCTSHSTEALACPNLTPAAHSGWRCRWLCHPVPVQAVSPGSVLPLCCPLLQPAPHGARACCTLWSFLPVLTLFSPFPISDPTQLSLCPYRWLLLTWVLNLALNFSFWTHP